MEQKGAARWLPQEARNGDHHRATKGQQSFVKGLAREWIILLDMWAYTIMIDSRLFIPLCHCHDYFEYPGGHQS